MAGGPKRPRDGRPGPRRRRRGAADAAMDRRAGRRERQARAARPPPAGGPGDRRRPPRYGRPPGFAPGGSATRRRALAAARAGSGHADRAPDHADRADRADRGGLRRGRRACRARGRGAASASGRMAPGDRPRAADVHQSSGPPGRRPRSGSAPRLAADAATRRQGGVRTAAEVRGTAWTRDRDRTAGPEPPDFARRDGPPVRRGSEAPPLEEGEELVAGRRPVEEAFAAGRPARRLLVTPARRQALERIVLHATTLRIPIVEVEGGSLTSLAGFDGHQGVAVVVEARRFASVDDILARAIERGEPPFVLVLDSLEDPQNVGTLLRSAEAAGVHGVVFPTRAPGAALARRGEGVGGRHRAPPARARRRSRRRPSPTCISAGCGSSARTPRRRSPPARRTCAARSRSWSAARATASRPTVRRRCDLFVRIPMRGAIGSLNAAVAGSVLLFEVVGQRDVGPRADVAPAGNDSAPEPPSGDRGTAVDTDPRRPRKAARDEGVDEARGEGGKGARSGGGQGARTARRPKASAKRKPAARTKRRAARRGAWPRRERGRA